MSYETGDIGLNLQSRSRAGRTTNGGRKASWGVGALDCRSRGTVNKTIGHSSLLEMNALSAESKFDKNNYYSDRIAFLNKSDQLKKKKSIIFDFLKIPLISYNS